MQTLQTSNEYENGKPKESKFVRMGFDFLDYEERSAELRCPRHGLVKATYYVNLKRGVRTEPECPLCVNEREETERKAHEEAERARIQKEREEFYRSANIEPEYWNKTLDDYKPITARQKEYLAAVKKLIETRAGKLIVLGGNGTGKSMLAAMAIKALGGVSYTMFQMSLKIRSLDKNVMSESAFADTLIDAPLLVIDEIGRSKGSEFETNLLSYILDKRHARNLPFIILSNTHFARDCPYKGCDKCFERYFDNDLLSRFKQDGKFIVFEKDAPDKRDPRNRHIFERGIL